MIFLVWEKLSINPIYILFLWFVHRTTSLAVKECEGNHEIPLGDGPRVIAMDADPLSSLAFKARFAEILRESPKLQLLLDPGDKVTIDDQSSGTFYMMMSSIGDHDSAHNAHLASKYIECDNFNKQLLHEVYINALSKILRSEEMLSLQKSIIYAEEFAKDLKESAEKWMDIRYPKSKIVAQILGFHKFLDAQGLLTISKSRKIALILGDEWMYQTINCTHKSSMTFEKSKNSSTMKHFTSQTPNPLIAPSIKSCSEIAPGVAVFTSIVAQSVLSSYPVAQAFELSDITTQELSKAAFFIFQYIFITKGSPKSAVLADFASRIVAKLETLSLPRVIRVMSNFVGKFLNSQGILKLDNAKELAQGFARAVEDSAQLFLDKSLPKSKPVALMLGSVRFLDSLASFRVESSRDVAFFFGNEWFCESLSKTATIVA